jgi:hypothetical protein
MRHDYAAPAGWQPINGMSLNDRALEILPSALAGNHGIDQDLVYSIYAYSGTPVGTCCTSPSSMRSNAQRNALANSGSAVKT